LAFLGYPWPLYITLAILGGLLLAHSSIWVIVGIQTSKKHRRLTRKSKSEYREKVTIAIGADAKKLLKLHENRHY
jgi:hypothetical protein